MPLDQTGIESKISNRKLSTITIQKENKHQILHEYKIGDQMLLETPENLQMLPTLHYKTISCKECLKAS
jgi:hypothetical protein